MAFIHDNRIHGCYKSNRATVNLMLKQFAFLYILLPLSSAGSRHFVKVCDLIQCLRLPNYILYRYNMLVAARSCLGVAECPVA